MRQIIKRVIKSFNKRWIGSLFLAIISFFVFYWNYKNWKSAFQYTLFMYGMFYFNSAVAIYYKDLKAHRFNFKAVTTPKSWLYFVLFTVGTIIVFLIFLPKIFWIYGAIMSGILLVLLFLVDLIRNGFR